MIGHFKIGALCMTILDEELNRAQEWKTELDQASKLRGADDQKKLQRRYKSLIKKQDSLFRIGTGSHIQKGYALGHLRYRRGTLIRTVSSSQFS